MNKTFTGGLFHNNLEGGRCAAKLTTKMLSLHALTEQGDEYSIEYSDLLLRFGGSEKHMLICRSTDRKTVFFCSDKDFLNELQSAGGARIGEQVRKIKEVRNNATKRTLLLASMATAILVAAVVLFAIIVPLVFNSIVDASLSVIPISVDEQIGELAFKQLDSQQLGSEPIGKIDTVDKANKESNIDAAAILGVLSKIAERLFPLAQPNVSSDQRFQFQLSVFNNTEQNAFALPGGHIVMNSGLLKHAHSADEVAAILAHEITHVVERHGIARAIRGVGLLGLVQLVLGDLPGLIATSASLLTVASLSSYSRAEESTCDKRSVEMLYQAGFNPRGLISFLTRMKTHTAEPTDSTPKSLQKALDTYRTWFGSHPAFDERIQAIDIAVNELEQSDQSIIPQTGLAPNKIDWTVVQKAFNDHR